jgi:hypothetical protein
VIPAAFIHPIGDGDGSNVTNFSSRSTIANDFALLRVIDRQIGKFVTPKSGSRSHQGRARSSVTCRPSSNTNRRTRRSHAGTRVERRGKKGC